MTRRQLKVVATLVWFLMVACLFASGVDHLGQCLWIAAAVFASYAVGRLDERVEKMEKSER